MTHIENIRDWLIANNLGDGYKVQPYEWVDTGITTDRFIAVIPDGGQEANSEYRQPYVRLLVIGRKAEAFSLSVVPRANDIINTLRNSYHQDESFLIEAVSDISVTARTTDGRPYCQINLRILASYEG